MKSLITTLCILGMIGLAITIAVRAGTESTVTCNVTAGGYSVSVSTTTYNYGTMTINSTASSTDNLATNDGQLATKFSMRGTDAATTSPYLWELSNDQGVDKYMHAFSATNTLASGSATSTNQETAWVALATGYQTLAASVALSGTKEFWLDMRTPSSAGASTTYGEIYETTVTVQAAAP